MKTSVKAILVAACLTIPSVSQVAAQEDVEMMGQGHSMLTTAVENTLVRLGIDTDGVDSLTLSETAEIYQLTNSNEESENDQRRMINDILEEARAR